jgi:hypothetical protein
MRDDFSENQRIKTNPLFAFNHPFRVRAVGDERVLQSIKIMDDFSEPTGMYSRRLCKTLSSPTGLSRNNPHPYLSRTG